MRACSGLHVLNTGPSAASCGTALSMSAYSSACVSGAAAALRPAATAAARPCGLAFGLAGEAATASGTLACRGGAQHRGSE